jgi:hypothetical protein
MSNLRTAAEQALQYRKKPVVIEAFQMTRERRKDNRDWPAWLNEAWCKPFDEVGAVSCEDYPNSVSLTDRLVIRTLEGVMTVGWDDWIIRGVAGELYACKPDIFAATYESVALAAEQPQPEALGYATRLATSLWEKHYKAVSPHWRPLNDTLGVLTQIDNMTCRLVPPPPAAEPSEASDAEVEAAWRAIPASHEDSRVSVITKGDVWVMLRAAAAARNSK